MRFVETVRTGGKGALLVGLMSLNLVSGNSLSYFYGYSSVGFGVQQSSDPFSSQNVNYTPQVSMVSSQSQNQSYDYGTSSYSTSVSSAATYSGGFSVLATTYGYSTPATAQAPTYSTQSTNTSTSGSWGSVSNSAAQSTVTFSSWNAAAGVSGMVNNTNNSSGQTGSAGGTTPYYNPFGSWNNVVASTAPAPSVYDIVYSDYSSSSLNSGGWAAVNMTVVPRVANQITTPSIPAPVVNTPSTPNVNLGNNGVPALSAPEPGTMLTMSAGLALLLIKFRRRRS